MTKSYLARPGILS